MSEIRWLSVTTKVVLRTVAIALLATAASCATTPQQRFEATRRLDEVWASENQATRAQFGSRVLNATPDQALRAAKAAMVQIGLVIYEPASSPPNVVARQTFAESGWSWSEAVRLVEEARMQQVFVQAIGSQGAQLQMGRGEETLTARFVVGSRTSAGTTASVDFESAPVGVDCASTACVMQIPPAALRAGFFEFWRAFDEELVEVRAQDAEKAAAARRDHRSGQPAPRRRQRQRARPPSEWVPPPSGWRPPPGG